MESSFNNGNENSITLTEITLAECFCWASCMQTRSIYYNLYPRLEDTWILHMPFQWFSVGNPISNTIHKTPIILIFRLDRSYLINFCISVAVLLMQKHACIACALVQKYNNEKDADVLVVHILFDSHKREFMCCIEDDFIFT